MTILFQLLVCMYLTVISNPFLVMPLVTQGSANPKLMIALLCSEVVSGFKPNGDTAVQLIDELVDTV